MGVSEATLYTWKSKYFGMEVNEARRLKELEDENRRLKQLVADLSVDREALKGIIRKTGGACRSSAGCSIQRCRTRRQ
jgi:putative transposase